MTTSRMTRSSGVLVLVSVLMLASAGATAHGLPGSTESVTQLPSMPFSGELVAASLIGPPSGSVVLHATLDVTWIPNPNMPASDLAMDFGIPLTDGSMDWTVTGADLGWDDGPGPFHAVIGTDMVNGEIFWPIPPSSVIHFDLYTASGTGGVWGQFQISTLTFEIEGELPPAAGSVPDGVGGTPLTVAKAPFGRIVLDWNGSCGADDDYELYEGDLDAGFDSHTARFCTTGGSTTKTFVPAGYSAYYLVVPTNGAVEGSYGVDSEGAERVTGISTCLAQLYSGCR